MEQSLKILIEGKDAKLEAQQLLSQSNIQGHILEDEVVTRSIDLSAAIEIIGQVGTVLGTAGSAVSLAHTIWKWRKELKEDQKIVLTKGEGETEERLVLEENITDETIEKFLNR